MPEKNKVFLSNFRVSFSGLRIPGGRPWGGESRLRPEFRIGKMVQVSVLFRDFVINADKIHEEVIGQLNSFQRFGRLSVLFAISFAFS